LHRFSGSPRKGQKLEEVTALLLEQIEAVKNGDFSEATMRAVINDLAIAQMKQMESNTKRASLISQAYIHGQDWRETVSFVDELRQVTKQQIMDFAKKNYTNNYVAVYKRSGENTNTTKVTKPPITPVPVNRDASSAFSERLLAIPVEKISPRFSDFDTDIQRATLKNGTDVLCVKNTENTLYNVNFVWDFGTKHDRRFSTALQYLDFIGAGTYTAEDLRKALYELGCTIRVSASTDAMTVELSGTEEYLEPALKLVEERFRRPVADTAALKLLVDGILKQRTNVKKNKSVILQQALMSYVTYGKRNPFTNILSEAELRSLTAADLVDVITSLPTLKHSVYYYGTRSPESVRTLLDAVHANTEPGRTLTEPEPYQWQDHSSGKVFFVDFDMVQAEVMMRIKLDEEYSVPTSAFARMYNEYNGGLSGVVFQTIRESKALAYSVEAGFGAPRRKGDPYVYSAYIGTQADKLPEALDAMHDVLSHIPSNEASFANAKQSIGEKIEAERFTRFSLLQQYDNLRRLGLRRDVREDIYAAIPGMTLADLQRIRDEKVGSKKFALLVIGSKNKLDMKALSRYGPVQELTTEEIFGY
ncbi:MAG: insulinase family protein, partial [Candidatus Kapaibacterium sp.]